MPINIVQIQHNNNELAKFLLLTLCVDDVYVLICNGKEVRRRCEIIDI